MRSRNRLCPTKYAGITRALIAHADRQPIMIMILTSPQACIPTETCTRRDVYTKETYTWRRHLNKGATKQRNMHTEGTDIQRDIHKKRTYTDGTSI